MNGRGGTRDRSAPCGRRHDRDEGGSILVRRGFALIAVLWIVAALTGIMGLATAAARIGQQATINRLALTRGRWAADACLAVAQARWEQRRLEDADTVDLGRRTRCAWRVSDPTALLNVNVARLEIMVNALGGGAAARAAVDSIVRLRSAGPITDLAQLADVPGLDSAARSVLTVDGPGSINANVASARVLGAVPGISPEVLARLDERRQLGRPVTGLDALVGDVSPVARAELLAHYADLARTLVFARPLLVVEARGWVEGFGGPQGLHATMEVLAVPLPNRLAIVRRRMW